MLSHFGETLESLRHERGWTRRQLATEAGVETSEVRCAEECAGAPHREFLTRLASALDMSPDVLLLAAGVVPEWLRVRARGHPEAFLAAAAAIEAPGKTAPPVLPDVEIPEVAELQTEFGSLYRSDCIPFMRGLADCSVDTVFADPPFNLAKDYGAGFDDERREQSYMDWSVAWLTEAVRVVKPGGSFFLYILPKWGMRLGAWIGRHLEFRHWIAVDLKFSLPITGRLYPSHYCLLYFTRGRRPTTFEPPRLPLVTCRHCGGELRDYGGYKDRMNPKGVNLTDVWTDLAPVRHARHKRRGANELPLKMLDRVLDISTKPGDLVLDPFGGSGTTYVAAELKERRWLGTELVDTDPIVERFEQIDREREHLEAIRTKVNTLFTADVLALRKRHGHDSSRYRKSS